MSNDITPEEKQLAEKFVNAAWSTRTRGDAIVSVARIIQEAGTFTPRPGPTVGERLYTEWCAAYPMDTKHLEVNMVTSLINRIDTLAKDAAKEGAEKMREKCAETFAYKGSGLTHAIRSIPID